MPADSTTTVEELAARRSNLRKPGLVALAFAAIGLAASAYLTVEHFSAAVVLACPENSTINCAKVTTSKWSHVLGIPVAVLGLAYFVVLVALCLPPAWRIASLDRWRVAAAAIGAASVIWLVYLELFQIDAICLWCTAVHAATIGLLAAVLLRNAANQLE
jgi:uncharacterized membrane protein